MPSPQHICRQHTLITVPSQVLLADVKVMVSIQLPEFAVYNIKVLIGEVICDLIYVILFFQESKSLKGYKYSGKLNLDEEAAEQLKCSSFSGIWVNTALRTNPKCSLSPTDEVALFLSRYRAPGLAILLSTTSLPLLSTIFVDFQL